MTKLQQQAPDFFEYLKQGLIIIEDYYYMRQLDRYNLVVYSDNSAVELYLEVLWDMFGDLYLDGGDIESYSYETVYDYSGCHYEGGIVEDREVSLYGNDVPLQDVLAVVDSKPQLINTEK